MIREIRGIEEARKIQGVKEVGTLKHVGEQATALHNSADRLGYVITQAETAEEAIAIAEKAIDMIDFVVE